MHEGQYMYITAVCKALCVSFKDFIRSETACEFQKLYRRSEEAACEFQSCIEGRRRLLVSFRGCIKGRRLLVVSEAV